MSQVPPLSLLSPRKFLPSKVPSLLSLAHSFPVAPRKFRLHSPLPSQVSPLSPLPSQAFLPSLLSRRRFLPSLLYPRRHFFPLFSPVAGFFPLSSTLAGFSPLSSPLAGFSPLSPHKFLSPLPSPRSVPPSPPQALILLVPTFTPK